MLGFELLGVAETTPTLDFITPWLNLTLSGVIVVMLVLRKGLVPEWVLKNAEAQLAAKEVKIAELEEALRDSTQLMVGQIVPLMTRAVDVEMKYLEELQSRDDPPQRPRGAAPRGR